MAFVSCLWSKVFDLLVWRDPESALSWLGNLTFVCFVLIVGWEKRCWGWGEQLCWGRKKQGKEAKGRWGKWCMFLAHYEIVGGELILDDRALVELVVHVGYSIVALGACSHWGVFSGKTNLLTSSCIVLWAGNCFPASCGKTAAGFHDTSVEDGSLATRCIFREHQLIETLIPCFIPETSTVTSQYAHCKNKCWEALFAAPNNSCFFFVEMFWKNLQRRSWWKNCTSTHTCSYVGDWWEGLIYLDLCFLEVVSWKKLNGFSVRCC